MATVKTRLCLISDTHTKTPFPAPCTDKPYRHPLPKSDVLLHAGDLTLSGRLPEHEIMIDMLKHADAELKIVIAGNHDISLDKEYYARMGVMKHGSARLEDPDEIRELYTNDEARAAGIVYMEEEVRVFELNNGARFTVYASPYTPEFCAWAFAYERDEDRFFNPPPSAAAVKAVPSFPEVDVMLTHGPPLNILDQVVHGTNVGCEHLLRACSRAKPRLHVFGHIHEGHGAVRHNWTTNRTEEIEQDPDTVRDERSAYYNASTDSKEPLVFGDETVFVNASVVTVAYRADNAPWLVDLDLPKASKAS